MWRLLRAVLVVGIAAVGVATPAGSRPGAKISVSPKEPVVAVIGSGDPVYQLAIVVTARFTPDALHDDARVTGISTKPGGVGFGAFTGYDEGNVLHGTAVYQNVVGAFQGDRILVGVKWHAYTPEVSGTVEGTATSSTVVQVPKREPAPRFVSEQKQHFAQRSTDRYAACAIAAIAAGVTVEIPPWAVAFGALAAESCAAGAMYHNMALDPIDLNFKVVAKPKTPSTPKVAPGKGLSATSAAALSKLLTFEAKEIGLTRAIVTAVNRSQGAHVKKQSAWEEKQVRAAGTYAAQLSSLLLAEAKLRPAVRRALEAPEDVTEEQAYTFQSSLISGPLPARLASGLSKLGVTKSDQKEIRAQLIVRNHPTLYDGDPFAKLADPASLLLLRQIAADLKAFSKRAAKDPLCPPDQVSCS